MVANDTIYLYPVPVDPDMVGTTGRRIAIAGLVVVLVLSLGAANATVGVQRTVLSESFVSESLAEEEAYTVLVDMAQEQLETEAANESGPGSIAQSVFPTVLTASYVQNQSEANLERIYDYLHGERSDVAIVINTTPLKADLTAEVVERMLADRGLADFDPTLAAMAKNESAYEQHREEFAAEQKARIQAETEPELNDSQLATAYNERRDEIRTGLVDELESRVAESDQPAALEPLLIEMGTLRIDALLDPDMTYETFTDEVDSLETELREAIRELVRSEVDQGLPDTIELTEQFGPEQREQLEQVRGVVGILDLLVYLLPLLALGVALLIGRLAATRSAGLFVVGGTVAVIGLVSALSIGGAGSRAETEVAAVASEEGLPAGLSDLVVGLLDQTVAVFVTQSWLLLALGVVLIVVGVAIRRELLPVENRPGESPAAESGTDSTPADEPPVDVTEETEDPEQPPVDEGTGSDGRDDV